MTSEASQPPQPESDPGSGVGLRRFFFPALFVAALFSTLWLRGAPISSSNDVVSESNEWSLGGHALGTTWSVKGWGGIPNTVELRQALEKVLDGVDASMSTWRKDSELSRMNRSGLTPVPVSKQLLSVLTAAEQVSKATNGAFDVTVGPLVAAWGFGAKRTEVPPDAAELAPLRARVGYTLLSIDATKSTVTRARDDVSIDLSAIAKGYAVDRMGDVLRAAGLTHWMVEVGGEVLVAGLNAESQSWKLGIEEPTAGGRSVALAIALTDGALATSGDYRQFRLVDGKMVSHTIDPRTGAPVSHGPASVSVIANDCMSADAWATALMVLGPEGLPLATDMGLGVLILERQPDKSIKQHMNAAFRARLLAK